jgi:hypothetical protein
MNKKFDFEIFHFIALIFATEIILSFTPAYFQLLFFLILLFVYSFSKRDYFWIAYFAAVIFETGGFFVRDMILGFGIIPFSLFFIFSITTTIKGYRKYRNNVFLLNNQYYLWIFYLFILVFIGLFYGITGVGKTGFRVEFLTIIFLLCVPTLFMLPKYFDNAYYIKRFAQLIFISVFINIAGQIFHLASGNPIFLALNPEFSQPGYLTDLAFSEKLIRPVWGHFILFIAMFFALYYIVKNDKYFNRLYLLIIVFACYVSAFIGATRGWILSFSFILFMFIIAYSTTGNLLLVIRSIVVLIILLALLITFSDAFRIQTSLASERLSTLEYLLKGDITAGGTTSRLTYRSDKVMDVFRLHPVFGNGFSNITFKAMDQHVGNQNMLMEGGIIGYLINLNIVLYAVFLSAKYHWLNKRKKNYKGELLLLIIFLLGLLIIHSSSTGILGYTIYIIHPETLFFMSLILGLANFVLVESRKNRTLYNTN